MPCEITTYEHGTTLCQHPAIAECCDCRVGLCSAHIFECDRCDATVCPDCKLDHLRGHGKL
jgi:hypothetical protein